MCNNWSEILTQFKVVNIAAAEPTSTQPDAAYSAGTRSLIYASTASAESRVASEPIAPETSESPTDMIDQLGGGALKSVRQGYGDGYSSDLISRYL